MLNLPHPKATGLQENFGHLQCHHAKAIAGGHSVHAMTVNSATSSQQQ